MSRHTYNHHQFIDGELTDAMLAALVEDWQRNHSLAVDGYAGPNTLRSIQDTLGTPERFYPLRSLYDGRNPVITSGFHTENRSRSTHMGVDFFYPWEDGDPIVPVGDGGAIAKKGRIRWWYPEDTHAVAAAAGRVQIAGNTKTGYRCWVAHEDGPGPHLRTGYFHLASLLVSTGDNVEAGQALGEVGDNPSGHDGKHLHFEVSPVDRYAPMNPRIWLAGAEHLGPFTEHPLTLVD